MGTLVKPISEQTIFISIASYCDPLLQFTINGALATATCPANLRFGIVDQSPFVARLPEAELPRAQISYVHIDPRDARGPCWARSIAMTLYDGEDWFFQIDSHMLFEAIKRRKPDFNESYYGFRAFGNLLEEAQGRGLLEFGRDEKSGAYVYRTSPTIAPSEPPVETVPPVLEALGLAELEHNPRNNRMRAR